MTVLLLTHPACLAHDTGPHHPERADRLRAVLRALDAPDFAGLRRAEAPLATTDQLARAHPPRYVKAILGITPDLGESVMLDADTVMSAGSAEAALRAAGAAVAAVDAVCRGEAKRAFGATRPPGHHAEPARPMGFCLFANAVVAARHAQAAHGLTRVAIADFDVHHGNGTQACVEADASILFASSHQSPCYRMEADRAHVEALWARARELFAGWTVNGSAEARWHGNLNIRRDGLDVARLMSDCREVMFSAGSAWASGPGRTSHVLKAIGLTDAQAKNSIRLGFGRYTTLNEVERAAAIINGAAEAQEAW
ncbi:hypothetical protein J4558_08015 [Leptolyngbya sp. 15MV]|nr:hypothetical protein J4558_08015 [Leptolyngbya sp. 15MV]